MRTRHYSIFLASAVLLVMGGRPALAQTGKLAVHAHPREAYIYVDDLPIVESRGHVLCLTAGAHKVDLYNYGYKPETRNVNIEAHKTTVLDVTMQATPGNVSGPWACITVKGADRNAILLNGTEPAVFFVGHGDEMNNEWGWHQELIVPPGKHQLTVMCNCAEPWTTTVDVQANQRVVVDAYKGVSKTEAWSRGGNLQSVPRFTAGDASAEVAVEKVTGQFAAAPAQINCGDSTHLTWSSTGAGKVTLNGETVGTNGDQTIQPKQSTEYKLVAAGPGGIYTSGTTVNVSNAINASLNVSPTEVRYHKVGDRVDASGSATVSWSAPGADNVSVDPLGSTGANGSREIQVTPTKTTAGPIDETVTYTLHAANACGGSETRTASLHITGSIDNNPTVNEATLETKLTFNSIYFPTNLPTTGEPDGGLVPSQQHRLEELVADFKEYLAVRPEANLILQAHADMRGSVEFNKALSQRRADRVKAYLVANGIPADRIQTQALGKEHNLTDKEVENLTSQNPNITPDERKRVDSNVVAFRLANNRRVDVSLSTTGQTSQRFFPYNSEDLDVLLGAQPAAKKGSKP